MALKIDLIENIESNLILSSYTRHFLKSSLHTTFQMIIDNSWMILFEVFIQN